MQQAIQVESPATALGNLQSEKRQQQHSWTRCEKDYSIVLKKSTGRQFVSSGGVNYCPNPVMNLYQGELVFTKKMHEMSARHNQQPLKLIK